MSADIELLRLAAKAAGMVILEQPWDDIDGWFFCEQHGKPAMHFRKYGSPNYSIKPWMPFDDDGDALRLAIALGLKIDIGRGGVYMEECGVRVHGYESRRELAVEPATDNGASLQAATRRAIVCAAARIGRAMP